MKERNLYGPLMTMTMKEGEENDDVECFHDSLDRLLSSSNTSCSCSPNTGSDSEEDPNHNFDYDLPVAPKFPVGVSKDYDVWILQPSSVQERRLRLIRQMGLSRDPSMLKYRPSLSLSMSNFGMEQCGGTFGSGNYENCDDECAKTVGDRGDSRGIVRSRSDGDCRNHRGLGLCDNDPDIRVLPSKPPRVKNGVECTRGSANYSEGLECNDVEDMASSGVCMIKNLDNGKEFVVDEVREDGMWEKIKEVGTGRHLTMEEFSTEMCVGTSPIVQELMRRQNFEDGGKNFLDSAADVSRLKNRKRGNWLRSIRNVASSVRGPKERRSSDERDTSSEKGGRRSSSATDDSQDVLFHEPERIRVKVYGKLVKDLTALYKSQEIQAHNGSIWAIKFSLDGKYLASAGEDCVIHVWQVVETERKGDFSYDKSEDGNFNHLFLANGSSEPSLDGHTEKKRRGRSSVSRKSVSFEQILVPETVFALSEKPTCSFQGHLADVLDLSWSQSQQLLSSSMDKTVRLWDLSSKSCLKIFSHNDYVTCIQFNPVDDRYFISGSLDAKVRIWSIPDHQVIDWSDLHEMVTAACYTPDGQGAFVGSYKGSCRLYNTSENKLRPKSQIDLQNKKKKSHQKKITGFQFVPGSTSEVLITSADSRVRVINGVDLVHKFKGFHNTHSQISASLTSNGKFVISASEDSYVYVWRHEAESQPNRAKGVTVTQSYEFFHCQDVSIAIPWPGTSPNSWVLQDSGPRKQNCGIDHYGDVLSTSHPTTPAEDSNESRSSNSPTAESNKYVFERISVTWPEEKLVLAAKNRSPHRFSADYSNGLSQNESSAWGMVIVTAGLRGDIRTFQNFGLNNVRI